MTDTDADAAANAVYAAWDDAFNRADPKDIASLYAGEALFLPATHDVIKGPAPSRTPCSTAVAANIATFAAKFALLLDHADPENRSWSALRGA